MQTSDSKELMASDRQTVIFQCFDRAGKIKLDRRICKAEVNRDYHTRMRDYHAQKRGATSGAVVIYHSIAAAYHGMSADFDSGLIIGYTGK